MNKFSFLLSIIALIPCVTSAQVGINVSNTQGVLHVDAARNNATTGSPTIEQQQDDFVISNTGNAGIGTTTPQNKLHIKDQSNPIRIEGLGFETLTNQNLLVVDNDGIVKKTTLQSASIPQPAVLVLNKSNENFLVDKGNGYTQTISDLSLIKNSISGFEFNSGTSTIKFPIGTYQISVVYEAIHNAVGCNLSSYFVDFPSPDDERRRIHTTSSHLEGASSNHGGTISFTVSLSAVTYWTVHLGRGQSGNCTANSPYLNSTGMNLQKNSTQIAIFRIGD